MSNEIEQLQADLARIQKIGQEVESLFTPAEIGPEGGTWQVRIGRGVASLRDQLAARDALLSELCEKIQWLFEEPEFVAEHPELTKALRALLARTPADAGAELARLREDNAHLRMEGGLAKFYKQEDELKALRAQLASAEARVEELTDEHTELAGKLDMACHRAEKAEARLRAVTEAGDAMRAEFGNLLYDLASGKAYAGKDAYDELRRAMRDEDDARSGDLPSASIIIARPSPEAVADAERALAGAVAMEDQGLVSYAQDQLAKAKSTDLPSANKGEPRCNDCAPEFGCWVNGNTCRKVPAKLAALPPPDPTLVVTKADALNVLARLYPADAETLGEAVDKLRRLAAHNQRLRDAAQFADLPPRITAAQLAEAIKSAYIIHGTDWREVAELVLPQLGDLFASAPKIDKSARPVDVVDTSADLPPRPKHDWQVCPDCKRRYLGAHTCERTTGRNTKPADLPPHPNIIECELIGFDVADRTLVIGFDRPIQSLPTMSLGQRVGFVARAQAGKEGA